MRAFHADAFVLPLPEGHTFPMPKYRLLREAVARTLPAVRVHEAPAASDGELALDVDFGKKTVGGSRSYLALTGGPHGGESTSWSVPTSFSSLAGEAAITQGSSRDERRAALGPGEVTGGE